MMGTLDQGHTTIEILITQAMIATIYMNDTTLVTIINLILCQTTLEDLITEDLI